ncbi:MAG: hypothetical protein ACR2G4_00800 [Pyrinomonadaceae bacterium]
MLTSASAQGATQSDNASGANVRRQATPRAGRGIRRRTPLPVRRVAAATPQNTTSVVTVTPHPITPDYLYGQANIAVRGNEDPVIRLGLAQHGPIVIEFPVSDNFFAVHPGGSSIVTYDESPTLATDHYLVFRAGSGFLNGVSDANGNEARASVSVQMQSGLFVTFLFYPVRDVARMAHRCVVTYARDDVVTARRAAGLAVNLDGRTPTTQSSSSIASRRVTGNAIEATRQDAETNDSTQKEQTASVTLESGELISTVKRTNQNRHRRPNDIQRESQRALREALAAPDKFNRWSAPISGLSVAAIAPVDFDANRRLTVIAVRNTTQKGLRLMPDAPDLDLVTLNEAGRAVQVRSINRLHTETSSVGGAIPAGATIYYAIIYESLILDAAQRVRLSVAQTTAADQPAATELSSAN